MVICYCLDYFVLNLMCYEYEYFYPLVPIYPAG
jgi:hypothetical protein